MIDEARSFCDCPKPTAAADWQSGNSGAARSDLIDRTMNMGCGDQRATVRSLPTSFRRRTAPQDARAIRLSSIRAYRPSGKICDCHDNARRSRSYSAYSRADAHVDRRRAFSVRKPRAAPCFQHANGERQRANDPCSLRARRGPRSYLGLDGSGTNHAANEDAWRASVCSFHGPFLDAVNGSAVVRLVRRLPEVASENVAIRIMP